MTESVNYNARANWLRASVLGAIDGIVSIAGLVIGVASATDSKSAILIAGLAGVLAGALSMAAGEYVSVSTQRDIERRNHEKHAHSKKTDGEFTSPWTAAFASAISFIIGSIIPIVAVLLPLGKFTIPVTFVSVILALVITGYWSAVLSDVGRLRVVVRVTLGGVIAMIVTYGIGSLFNL